MAEHLFKNWIVYLLLGGFIWFVASVYIHSHREEKKRQEQDKKQEKNEKMTGGERYGKEEHK